MSESVQKSVPMTVRFGISGSFARGFSWDAEVRPDRTARLVVHGPSRSRPPLVVTAEQWSHLRVVVERERFFALRDEYGGAVADSSVRTLTVIQGRRRKAVTLRYLQGDDPRLSEIQRVLRVWQVVQSWVRAPDAFDSRPWDDFLLNPRRR